MGVEEAMDAAAVVPWFANVLAAVQLERDVTWTTLNANVADAEAVTVTVSEPLAARY